MNALFNLRCCLVLIFFSCVHSFLSSSLRSTNLKIVSSVLEKTTFTPPLALLATNNGGLEILRGDNMFKVHSVCAISFGLPLLLIPKVLLPFTDAISGFVCQEWSIFIITVAFIAFNAPNTEFKTKQLLARAFASMCLAECILLLNNMVSTLQMLNMRIFIVDAVTLVAFGFIVFGYVYSGYVFSDETKSD